MPENKPMKAGAHLLFNDQILDWFRAAFEDIRKMYDDDAEPEDVLVGLGSLDGWIRANDKFGQKVYVSTPFPCGTGTNGELRLGLALRRDGTFNIDIRTWGEY